MPRGFDNLKQVKKFLIEEGKYIDDNSKQVKFFIENELDEKSLPLYYRDVLHWCGVHRDIIAFKVRNS